jgi:hypothetical protein
MRVIFRAIIPLAFLTIWLMPGYARAAGCTDPTAAVGTVMYNQDYDAFQGCTAVKGWVVFNPPGHPSGGGSDPTGCGAIGDVCSETARSMRACRPMGT